MKIWSSYRKQMADAVPNSKPISGPKNFKTLSKVLSFKSLSKESVWKFEKIWLLMSIILRNLFYHKWGLLTKSIVCA